MPETYSKPCQISMMMGHIKNPCIVRKVYSGIYRHTEGHSAILSHVKAYFRILRHIQALLRDIEPLSNTFKTLCNTCTYSCTIFRTLTHLELEASSKACRICKITRHIQSSGKVKILCKYFQGHLGIFRDIDAYSSTLTDVQLGGGGRSSLSFLENRKKYSDFGKEGPDCVHPWVKLSI